MTTIPIMIGLVHHSGAYRVQVDITDQLRKISITLTKNCLVSALQQVTHATITAVVVLAITSQNAVHDPAHGVRLPLNQEMHMVSHQAVGIKKEWEFAFLYRQKGQKLLIVSRRIEYRPPIIAASDHVIETTLNFGASFPGHGRRMLAGVDPTVNAL